MTAPLRTGFAFGTKADTLRALDGRLDLSRIPPFVTIDVESWKARRPEVLQECLRGLDRAVIIRSSAAAEDGEESALAGAFDSVGPVDVADTRGLADAIDEVIAGYGSRSHDSDQVLVQEMITGVTVSGVVFTREMSTGAPYYVINYDDESGTTDTVTSGTGYTNRTLYVHRDAHRQLRSVRFRTLLDAVREIEAAVGDSSLDIEFALDDAGTVHLFQVRRITSHHQWADGQENRISRALTRIEENLADRFAPSGGPTLGTMPDWNPAEMIGMTPRPLALSIYRWLITDQVWARARGRMGYMRRSGARLMTALAGQPFIDVAESFWSFLPARIDRELGSRLVENWLTRLRTNPHLHDKVEFDVALTAFAPDFDSRIAGQGGAGLDPAELATFRGALRDLTNELIGGRRAPMGVELASIEVLSQRRRAGRTGYREPSIRTVLGLLDDAVEFGTTSFAVLARHAFIATVILDGLVAVDALEAEDVDRLRRTIPTVATDFISDVHRLRTGETSEDEIIDRYGHLRPGTYDILSERYDQQVRRGINPFSSTSEPIRPEAVALTEAQLARVDDAFAECGITAPAADFFHYAERAIQGREFAKFVFSANVSDLLEVIADIGGRFGLSREELSYVDVRQFIDAFIEPEGASTASQLADAAARGRERHLSTTGVRLPSLIIDSSDVWIVPLRVESPNFVTRLNAEGAVVEVTGLVDDPSVLDGKIVAIASADPGFDWIFARPIAGLVTQYGGVNSHMAIRCAEFGLPAAIGCGEQIFLRVTQAQRVNLKCAESQILAVA